MFKGTPHFDGMSVGQSTIMMEGDENWDDEDQWEHDSNITDMVVLRDEDDNDLFENGELKPVKRSKSLDKGIKVNYKEAIMKKTQMIGYAYEDRRMSTRASDVKGG